ncbi:C7orf31 [Branchiostoma lanceolatum]|uniref:C7orf31 protein n=1 Tax=Branchiostoma lanceolatum TaxID=7740 RepID=A0A8J9YUA8_BRALA|nr:C7orf31 [Branchiostoma lanceolatum]
MAATQALPLSHYYKETQGTDYLGGAYKSSELFNPLQTPQRPTVNEVSFEKYRALVEKNTKAPWGRGKLEYGGERKVQLPDQYRPKGEPPTVVQKTHRHYGSGADGYPRGGPIQQYYDLTQLKRSNVRWNDQLLTNPQKSNMETVMIDLPFPAEHPYASHIARYAVIPKFDCPDDPKRGVRARRDQPLHHETPATPHNVRINSKSRGGPYRWETQDLPSEGHKRALTWPGDDFYHMVKYPPDGGRQQYYPIPPKLVLPNLTERPLEKTLDPRTATALRNVEKSQWQTTYKRTFTGYGPSNELHLDNYHENMVKSMVQGKEVDELKPATVPVFFPPRPLEGRISREIGPAVRLTHRLEPAPGTGSGEGDEENQQVEREYLNYPQYPPGDPRHEEEWRIVEDQSNPDHNLQLVEHQQQLTTPIPHQTATAAQAPEKPPPYSKGLKETLEGEFRELEKTNRYALLSTQTPQHDIVASHHKSELVNTSTKPKVFIEHHTGMYRERDPYIHSGQEQVNDALVGDYATKISDMGRVATLHDRQLTPGYAEVMASRGSGPLDLPEREKPSLAGYAVRQNPYSLSDPMTKRPDMRPLHEKLAKTCSLPPGAKLTGPYYDEPNRLNETSHSRRTSEYNDRFSSLQPTASFGSPKAHLSYDKPLTAQSDPTPYTERNNVLYDPRLEAEFSRMTWRPGTGTPRPQTSLLKIQESFSKTDAHKKFHQSFEDKQADLRDNSPIGTSNKHYFSGFNSYYWHN